MIGVGAKPLAAPLRFPPSRGRRVAPGPGPALCAADPVAQSPPVQEDAGPVAQSPPVQEEAAPAQRTEAAAAAPRPSPSRPVRASSALSGWSRTRALRSGRRLGRATPLAPVAKTPPSPLPPVAEGLAAALEEDFGDDDLCPAESGALEGKSIYMVSDGTGETAENSVRAALGQFENCLVDRQCAVNTHLFSGVVDNDRLIDIIKQAAKEGALVLYTLADPSMAEAIKKACDFWEVPCTDVLRPTVDAIASHIGVAPSGIPRSSPNRKTQLTEDYFRRIEAIDFTIKHDDGAQTQNLDRADIVLVGVSRTGKTPLSIYLAQKGYKVANVPFVSSVPLPKSLFEINQDKIFGLTINPVILQAIRKTRAKTLGFDGYNSNYAEMDHVRHELAHAKQIYAQNPSWPVIEVTGKAVEETAAIVVRIYHDRKQKCSMPRISKRF
ncbi:hypothetical protein EJB05_11992, partial [Eragrostis curvula]